MKKQSFFYFLICGLGGAIGMVVILVIAMAFEYRDRQYPKWDTQVIEHLESCGYPVDTLDENLYSFCVEGDNMVFDYYPEDQSYLCLLAGYDMNMNGCSMEALTKACLEVTKNKRNCSVVPICRDEELLVRIYCQSFVNPDEALDTRIIDRSIRIIEEAYLALHFELKNSSNQE